MRVREFVYGQAPARSLRSRGRPRQGCRRLPTFFDWRPRAWPRVRHVAGYPDPLQIDIDREGQGARLQVQFYGDTAPGGPEAFARHLRAEIAQALR